jgi:hypothetical protein
VAEYLIRTSHAHGWPALHDARLAEVLLPDGLECHVIDGYGDFRIRCGDAEISFSAEDVGWQVAVEGELAAPEQLIAQVTRQVEATVGEPCDWLALG